RLLPLAVGSFMFFLSVLSHRSGSVRRELSAGASGSHDWSVRQAADLFAGLTESLGAGVDRRRAEDERVWVACRRSDHEFGLAFGLQFDRRVAVFEDRELGVQHRASRAEPPHMGGEPGDVMAGSGCVPPGLT